MPFDLSEYLCPISASRYLLIGVENTNAYEICSTIQDGKGYRRFVKNSHCETLWFDDQFVYRGLDTSGLPGEVYAQWTGERYGAAWAKRFMDIGGMFKRHPDIRYYDANGNEKRRADGGVSYLRLVKHHDTLAFPQTGRPISDVLELNWTSDPDGHSVIETYWYARGVGLVGFDYLGDPPFHSRYAGQTGQMNGYAPLPNFNEPTPPPVEGGVVTPPPVTTDPEGEGIRAACNAPNGVYLRKTPSTSGDIIRALKYAEEVTVWAQPAVPSGKYTFIPVLTKQGEQGCVAQMVDINGVWSATFIPAKLPTTFTIKAPFRRYRVTGRFNDYRDYSQIAPAKKQAHEGLDCVDANAESYKTDPVVHVGAPGTVAKVDYDPKGYGNYIEVNHGNGFVTVYAHLAEIYVRSGQKLADWQIIGLMGYSGNVYPAGEAGAHVHLTLSNATLGLSGYVYPSVLDPAPYLVPALTLAA